MHILCTYLWGFSHVKPVLMRPVLGTSGAGTAAVGTGSLGGGKLSGTGTYIRYLIYHYFTI